MLSYAAMAKRKNRAAAALSKLGARKGGKAVWANVSPEERSRRMRELIKRRWAKVKRKKRPS